MLCAPIGVGSDCYSPQASIKCMCAIGARAGGLCVGYCGLARGRQPAPPGGRRRRLVLGRHRRAHLPAPRDPHAQVSAPNPLFAAHALMMVLSTLLFSAQPSCLAAPTGLGVVENMQELRLHASPLVDHSAMARDMSQVRKQPCSGLHGERSVIQGTMCLFSARSMAELGASQPAMQATSVHSL